MDLDLGGLGEDLDHAEDRDHADVLDRQDHQDLLGRLDGLDLAEDRGHLDRLAPLVQEVVLVLVVVLDHLDRLAVLGLTVVQDRLDLLGDLVHLDRLVPQDPWDRLACLVVPTSSPSCLATILPALRLVQTCYSPKTVPRLD